MPFEFRMLNPLRAIFYLALLSVALLRCTYEPKGSFVNPIKPPTGDNTKVLLTQETDLVNLSLPTTFSFTVTPADKGSYYALITYDNTEVKSAASATGTFTFTLSPNGHPVQGELKIKVTYPSRSPSLAGQLGMEIILFEKTWKVITDTSPPPPIPAPDVAIENGHTMIHWQSPLKFNFAKLIVVRTLSNGNIDSLAVADIHDTSLEDKSYAGGDVSYSVLMKGYFRVNGPATKFTCSPVTATVNPITGILSWPTPLIYSNPNLYVQIAGQQYPINSPGSYNPNFTFGTDQVSLQTVTIAIVPKAGENGFPGTTYYTSFKAPRGYEIKPFMQVQYNSGDDSYIVHDKTRITKLNAQTFSEIASKTVGNDLLLPLLISSNGQYGYVWNNDNIFRFDPATLNIIETIPMSSLVGPGALALNTQGIVTNTNIIAINFLFTGTYIIDMNTKSVVWHNSNYASAILSPDGNFLLVDGNTIYGRGSGNWDVLVGTLESQNVLVDLQFREGTNLLYGRDPFTGLIYSYNVTSPVNGSGQLPSTLTPIPASIGFSYDQASGNLCVRTGIDLHIYNPSTFTEQSVVKNINWGAVFYTKNALFHQLGYVLPNGN